MIIGYSPLMDVTLLLSMLLLLLPLSWTHKVHCLVYVCAYKCLYCTLVHLCEHVQCSELVFSKEKLGRVNSLGLETPSWGNPSPPPRSNESLDSLEGALLLRQVSLPGKEGGIVPSPVSNTSWKSLGSTSPSGGSTEMQGGLIFFFLRIRGEGCCKLSARETKPEDTELRWGLLSTDGHTSIEWRRGSSSQEEGRGSRSGTCLLCTSALWYFFSCLKDGLRPSHGPPPFPPPLMQFWSLWSSNADWIIWDTSWSTESSSAGLSGAEGEHWCLEQMLYWSWGLCCVCTLPRTGLGEAPGVAGTRKSDGWGNCCSSENVAGGVESSPSPVRPSFSPPLVCKASWESVLTATWGKQGWERWKWEGREQGECLRHDKMKKRDC